MKNRLSHWCLALCLVSLPLLQGCAAALIGGGAAATKIALDSRQLSVQLDDSGLSLRARSLLNDVSELDSERVRVVAYAGQVLLLGQVADQELKQLAGNTLDNLAGMEQLFNQLRIKDRASLGDRADDSWITTRIKSRLLRDTDHDLSGVKVVTENNEVFLLGLVDAEQAAAAIKIARNTRRVERVIDLITHLES